MSISELHLGGFHSRKDNVASKLLCALEPSIPGACWQGRACRNRRWVNAMVSGLLSSHRGGPPVLIPLLTSSLLTTVLFQPAMLFHLESCSEINSRKTSDSFMSTSGTYLIQETAANVAGDTCGILDHSETKTASRLPPHTHILKQLTASVNRLLS